MIGDSTPSKKYVIGDLCS